MLLLTLFAASTLITCIASGGDLHNFMDTEELKFYFGSEKDLPEYEIVDLPDNLWGGRESVVSDELGSSTDGKYLSFTVFNQTIQLHLYINRKLISPSARIIKRSTNETSKHLKTENNACHYLHAKSDLSAAISNCDSKEISGLIFTPEESLEIKPLSTRLKFIVNLKSAGGGKIKQMNVKTTPHLIMRSVFSGGNFGNDFRETYFREKAFPIELKRIDGLKSKQLTVEIGLFFDEAFYKFFAPFLEHDEKKLRNFILSYMNGVQALYHHRTLSRKIDFTIVYLEIMEEQPSEMPHAYGERNALIDNFCQYQMSINPVDDKNPDHWDMSVYVSGLDFFHWTENGQKNGATMGLATVGGVCNDEYNCIIAEFGSINQFGRPYPSSGFTSVYILAHEIGHNLGMSHDSIDNACPKDGYIMSPSRGTQGETTWSSCSENVAHNLDWAKCLYDQQSVQPNLDHWIHEGYPGISYTAKEQCEILLRDRDTYVFFQGDKSQICDNLSCRTPNKPGIFFAGPALEGTECGNSKWCEGGKCVSENPIRTTTIKPKPSYGPWKVTNCKSNCIKYGKGYQAKRRFCNEPGSTCDGASSAISLCDDRRICSTRQTVMEFGSQKCKEFSQKIPQVDASGFGLQASYDNLKLWMACAIFCKRKNSTAYFTPRVELNELGVSGYFPDGTFCHREGKENFYCIQHHCLPESTKFSKSLIEPDKEDL